jgi:hypothetical protein
MDPDQEAFLQSARARLREIESLRAEAHDGLTSDDFEVVNRELMELRDEIHASITQALRGQPASLNPRPGQRYTVYRLDLPAQQWLRILTTRDLPTATRELIEQQDFGESAHLVAWVSLADRAAQEHDQSRFKPPLHIADASDHVIRL